MSDILSKDDLTESRLLATIEKLKEDLRWITMASRVELCQKHFIQLCHTCECMTCGDNQSPAKRTIRKLAGIVAANSYCGNCTYANFTMTDNFMDDPDEKVVCSCGNIEVKCSWGCVCPEVLAKRWLSDPEWYEK